MSVSASEKSDTVYPLHQNSIYRSRHRLVHTHEGPYFFRSLVWGLYRSGQYSDFVIRVKGSPREFHVHRAVICPQSSIFEAACRGQFIEASSNSMTLTDDDPEIVERMIKYLYTHRYDDAEDWNYSCCDNGIKRIRQHYEGTGDEYERSEDEERHSVWPRQGRTTTTTNHSRKGRGDHNVEEEEGEEEEGEEENEEKEEEQVEESDSRVAATLYSAPLDPPKSLHVYAIADKYLIYPLKDLARTRFSNWAHSHWWTRGFVSAAREIFDNETGNYADLKEVILSTITLHADTLLCGRHDNKSSEGKPETEMHELMQEYSEVSVEVLRRTLDRTRIRQRGLEVDIADLESRVKALKVENKKIAVLQNRNHSLNKELLDIRMVLLAWKKDLKNYNGSTSTSTLTGERGRGVGARLG